MYLEFAESMSTYSLVDLVVFDEQHLVTLAAKSPLQFLEDKLLADDHLLRCILVAVRTRLALLLWVEDDSKLRWLQRSIDELQTSIRRQLFVVVD